MPRSKARPPSWTADSTTTTSPASIRAAVTSGSRPACRPQLAVGVRGFPPKTVSAQVLADVVRTVHRGDRYVDPETSPPWDEFVGPGQFIRGKRV